MERTNYFLHILSNSNGAVLKKQQTNERWSFLRAYFYSKNQKGATNFKTKNSSRYFYICVTITKNRETNSRLDNRAASFYVHFHVSVLCFRFYSFW